MKIILDNDGTLTDFNKFIQENAIPYFSEKYGMEVVYPNKLEIEDILDMKNFFIRKGYSVEAAEKKVNEVLDEFWIGLNFVKFSLLNRFRDGVKEFVNEKLKEGHDIQIHTSRAKTCQNNIIGQIARKFTILQYRLNGIFIPIEKFHFYENDEEKIKGIIGAKPDLVFEDKPEIINKLVSNNIKTICVDGSHNKDVLPGKNTERIQHFYKDEIKSKVQKLVGVKNLKYYDRALKSDKFFRKLQRFSPLIISKFKPIILNEENMHMDNEGSTIYAPNHRSTLDPLVITAILQENVHWAALLRFFKGEDSIFNNSKNPLLCKITAKVFKNLEYFPIDRKCDNPDANNYEAIKDMNNFLKIQEKIGIFGEGTTRRPEGQDFGTFDDAFLLLAKKTNATIRPITTLWIKDLNLGPKVIVNFGEPFKVGEMSIEEAMEYFLNIQQSLLQQNEKIRESLSNEQVKKYFKR